MEFNSIDVLSFLEIIGANANFSRKCQKLLKWYCKSFSCYAAKVYFIKGETCANDSLTILNEDMLKRHSQYIKTDSKDHRDNKENKTIKTDKKIISERIDSYFSGYFINTKYSPSKSKTLYMQDCLDGFCFGAIGGTLKKYNEDFVICLMTKEQLSTEAISWLYVLKDILLQALELDRATEYLEDRETWYDDINLILSKEISAQEKIIHILEYAKKKINIPYSLIDKIEVDTNRASTYLSDYAISSDKEIENKFLFSSQSVEKFIAYYPYKLKKPFYYHDDKYSILNSELSENEIKAYFGIHIITESEIAYILSFFSFTEKETPFTNKEIEFIKFCTEMLKELVVLNEREKVQEYEQIKNDNILNNIKEGVVVFDGYGLVKYMNQVAQTMTGYVFENDSRNPVKLKDVVKVANRSTNIPLFVEVEALQNSMPQETSETTTPFTGAIDLIRTNGDKLAVDITANQIYKDSKFYGTNLILRDITDARVLEDKLEFHTKYDMLTGFIKREAFEDVLRGVIGALEYSSHKYYLLYIDIDNFMVVNDKFGHLAGDKLLAEVSAVLRGNLENRATIARIAGDEFAALIETYSLDGVKNVASKIISDCKLIDFKVDKNTFPISVSIGISEVEKGQKDVAKLMLQANSACRSAKTLGKGELKVCDEDDVKKAIIRHDEIRWLYELDNAYVDDRIKVFHQKIDPISKRADKNLVLVEILMRMEDTKGSLVNPGLFVPLLERNNLMPKFDRYIVNYIFKNYDLICEFLYKKYSRDYNLNNPQYLFNINVSGTTINAEQFENFIIDMMNKYPNVPPSSICFEITETVAIESLAKAEQLITTLQEKNFKFALDDFGVGMSSFAYLKQLPVNYIKIDGKFINNINNDNIDQAIVETILKTANVLNIHTIAESVENEQIRRQLVRMGVEYGQGFHLNMPSKIEIK